MTTLSSLTGQAAALLDTADPRQKCLGAQALAVQWRAAPDGDIGTHPPPARPARPAHPVLLAPKDMPRRSYSGTRGRIALIHALAHIELNAVDLALDILCRYGRDAPPRAFYDDWVEVAADEARHHLLLEKRLNDLGAAYGDLPAHDGLWQAAEKTAGDLLERLAVAPLALEARALDTTGPVMAKLIRGGDAQTPETLAVIYDDEIKHVAKGMKWFNYFAAQRGQDAGGHYRALIAQHFPNGLKPPFNHEARAQAGFPRTWYEDGHG